MRAIAKKEPTTSDTTSPVLGYLWPTVLALGALVVSVALITATIRHPEPPAAAATHSGSISTKSIDPVSGSPATPASGPTCPSRTRGKQIVIGLAVQRMVLCLDGREVDDVPVTTGRVARGAGTPMGTWTIESHDVNRTLSGPGYSVFVRYWLHIVGDIGFHDSPWQKFPYGDTTDYKTQGSQGCIHVPPTQMRKLYSWADDGTPITIAA